MRKDDDKVADQIIIVVIITCFSKFAFEWRLEHDITSIHTENVCKLRYKLGIKMIVWYLYHYLELVVSE